MADVRERKNPEDYIGDGVYVEFDGFGVWVKANDHKNPTDKVYLEPEVFAKLLRFAQRIGWKVEPQ